MSDPIDLKTTIFLVLSQETVHVEYIDGGTVACGALLQRRNAQRYACVSVGAALKNTSLCTECLMAVTARLPL